MRLRILVTGATGFIGRAVCDGLAANGYDVCRLGHAPGSARSDEAEIAVDIRDRDGVEAAAVDCDAVCHLAGLSRERESFAAPERFFSVNVEGTAVVAHALAQRATQPHLVHFSSAAVYGRGADRQLDEDDALHPVSPYGWSKLAAEHVLRAAVGGGRLRVTVLRPFNVTGSARYPDPDRSRLLPRALSAAGTGSTLIVNGDGTAVRDWVHVDDVTSAVVAALQQPPASLATYNVGSVAMSVNELLDSVRMIHGVDVAVVHGPAAAEAQRLLADTRRLRGELGWKPAFRTVGDIVGDLRVDVAGSRDEVPR